MASRLSRNHCSRLAVATSAAKPRSQAWDTSIFSARAHAYVAAAIEAVRGIFASCQIMSFVARNIYQDGETTLIEFVLTLDDKVLTGMDLIEWHGDKMKELRAYLDV